MPPTSPDSAEQRSLLEWLGERYPDTPRTRLKSWFQAGRVRLDGVVTRRPQDRSGDPGERLQLLGVGSAAARPAAVTAPQRWRLLHRDADLLVVDKAAGLLAVPAPGRSEPSVLDLLATHLAESAGASTTPLAVHRLDAYTSGLLCFAANSRARAALIAQLREGRIEREYLALVEGEPSASQGVWRQWLHLDPESGRQRPCPPHLPGAEQAVTHFRLLRSARRQGRLISLLHLRLETGLKHQIRLQAAAEGVPLLGDRTYHPALRSRAVVPPGHPERQALHAWRLSLDHPRSGQRVVWTSPLPPDLARYQLGPEGKDE